MAFDHKILQGLKRWNKYAHAGGPDRGISAFIITLLNLKYLKFHLRTYVQDMDLEGLQ